MNKRKIINVVIILSLLVAFSFGGCTTNQINENKANKTDITNDIKDNKNQGMRNETNIVENKNQGMIEEEKEKNIIEENKEKEIIEEEKNREEQIVEENKKEEITERENKEYIEQDKAEENKIIDRENDLTREPEEEPKEEIEIKEEDNTVKEKIKEEEEKQQIEEKYDNDQNNETDTRETTTDFASFRKQVLELVNNERRNAGLNPLVMNQELSKVADIKSQDMIENNYFAHNSPKYGSPFDMIEQFEIKFTAAGENIAMSNNS